MAFVPVPNVVQVDTIFLLDGQRVENTSYWFQETGWDLSQIDAWLTDMNTVIQTSLLPFLTSSIQLIELVARLLDTASSIGLSYVPDPIPSGSVAAEALPNNDTYTISFKTGLTGRSFRGRNYVPGLTIDSVVSNNITSAFRTALLAYYNALKAQASASGITMVVVSRYSGVNPITRKPIPRVEGVSTPITTFTTFDTVVDSQRRRLPGRGR